VAAIEAAVELRRLAAYWHEHPPQQIPHRDFVRLFGRPDQQADSAEATEEAEQERDRVVEVHQDELKWGEDLRLENLKAIVVHGAVEMREFVQENRLPHAVHKHDDGRERGCDEGKDHLGAEVTRIELGRL